MAETAKWYVIHTYSGYENKVVQDIKKAVEYRGLHDLILEVQVPTEMVNEITNGKEKQVESKVFPSYVMLKMIYTDDTWHIVKNIRGVTGFVGPGSEPTPLTDEEVLAMGVVPESTVRVDYQVGDDVVISGTTMDGMKAVVKSIDLDNEIVEVLVDMFGRETSTTLKLDQVILQDK